MYHQAASKLKKIAEVSILSFFTVYKLQFEIVSLAEMTKGLFVCSYLVNSLVN
jgi:hypothetical protein